ncbi:MAG: PTS sugar transporter subunit IIC [Spirochaetes bacterium]|nr:PTS sugar transporter subunit IIC [Spirochaetota bacterium]
MPINEIIGFSSLIAIFNLDERHFGTFSLSRPLVCGVIFGIILKNFYVGLYVGVIMEMFTVNQLPVGNFITPSGPVLAGLGIYLSNYYYQVMELGHIFPLILLFSLFMGHVSKRVNRMLWVIDDFLVDKFISQVQEGRIHFAFFNMISLGLSLVFFTVLSFGGIYLGILAINSLSRLVMGDYLICDIMKYITYYLPLFSMVYFLNISDVHGKIYLVLVGIASAVILNFFHVKPIMIFISLTAVCFLFIFTWNFISVRLKL